MEIIINTQRSVFGSYVDYMHKLQFVSVHVYLRINVRNNWQFTSYLVIDTVYNKDVRFKPYVLNKQSLGEQWADGMVIRR